ncbi:putative Vacuolar protein sorting 11 [Operophtera brumata]|uniref:Putative Vacuolar protein sorting 11 n=1 Tax=Operophtera brumata TaxID=104452 RepID=A0A0L7KXQ2_OPEBR|nr:putative Vacuolar protein sorting 11 [Operophtera brumata]
MRLIEQARYSSSLEANLNKLEPVHSKTTPYQSPTPARKAVEPPHNISSVINSGPKKNTVPVKNPFDEDNYDEAKNPFADDPSANESNEPTNPFSEEDDYDKNLNPFS